MGVQVNDSEDGLYQHFSLKSDPGQAPLRIDRFLVDKLPNVSRNKIQLAAKSGLIRVDQKVVKPNFKIKASQHVEFYLPHPKRTHTLEPEQIDLHIVYEDDDVLVVNKPAGLVVHPGHGNYSGTLVNGLMYHYSNLFNDKTNLRPGLVHRIDKNTSGLLVIAKNDESLAHLSKQFFNRTTQRTYWALVWGEPDQEHATIEGHIGRHLKDRLIMQVFEDGSQGKSAVTHYKTIEKFGYLTLVECKLDTGRTHQIRAHFKHIGHPLFNDQRYGGDRILKGTTFAKYKQFVENGFSLLEGQALHAKSLGFQHPKTGENLFFETDLPVGFSTLLDKWRVYIEANF